MKLYFNTAVIVFTSFTGLACAGSTPPANDVSGSPTSNTNATTGAGFGDETNTPPTTSTPPTTNANQPDNGSTRGTGTDAPPAGTGDRSGPGLGGVGSGSGPGGNGTGATGK